MIILSDLLKKALHDNRMDLSEAEQQQLVSYLELLRTWNHAFNLTAITDPHDMVYLHLIDSLAAAPFIHGKRMLDVGSGAGLPGIPLAVTHPDQHWMVLDKNSKKTRFLTQAAAELHLKNVEAIYSRAEDYKPAQGFDSIVSRAYGTLRLFIESTQHLLNSDGIFIAMKGKYPQDELDHLPEGFEVKSITPVPIEGLAAERHIITMQRKR